MEPVPYTMADVISLLPLTVRRRRATGFDVDCPFCNNHKRGKMSVTLDINAFRCNYCNKSGGMLDLYMQMTGVSRFEARREIMESLHLDDATKIGRQQNNYNPKSAAPPLPLPKTIDIASPEVLHDAFSAMFSLLTLSQVHKENLLSRGFSAEEIERYGFKSTPAFGFMRLAATLAEMGHTTEGVPGFYTDKQGRRTINFHARCSGILIPVVSIDGMIAGAQLRMDREFDGRKYLWLSSTGKEQGTGSGSPVHFVGDPRSDTVYITEGPLKADLAHILTGKTFAAVAGATQYKNLETLLLRLSENGTKNIVEAYDADKLTNEHVQRGSYHLLAMVGEMGMTAHRLTWDAAYKGIDDFLVAKQAPMRSGN